MVLIIILGWILHVMAAPTIIWVLYGVLIICWIITSLINMLKILREAL